MRLFPTLLYLPVAACSLVLPLQAHDDLGTQIALLTFRIGQTPSDASLYFYRAELERAQLDGERARLDYHRALDLDSTLHAAVLGEALSWLAEGKPATALPLFESFLTSVPGSPEGLLGTARCLARLDRPADSAAAFAELIRHTAEPTPDQYAERAGVLSRAGMNREALAALDEGIGRLGPIVTLEEPAIDLALRLRQFEDALARLTYFVDHMPRPESWLARRALVYHQMGKTDESTADRLAALAAIARLPIERRNDRATLALQSQLTSIIQ